MERGSDKHGPRLDEEMENETRSMAQGSPPESRAQEGRQAEPAAEGEPSPDARVASPPGELNRDALEERSELARFLEPSAFPATKKDLVDAARRQHAPGSLIAGLEGLPEGRSYENVQAVWEDLSDAATDEV